MAERTTPPAKKGPKPRAPRRTAEVIPPERTGPVSRAKPRGQRVSKQMITNQSEEGIQRDAECMRLRTLGWTRP